MGTKFIKAFVERFKHYPIRCNKCNVEISLGEALATAGLCFKCEKDVDPLDVYYYDIIEEIKDLHEKKGKDYNSSFPMETYFLLGDYSLLNEIWKKTLRLVSLFNKNDEPANESIEDSIRDIINYSLHWLAYRRHRDRKTSENDLSDTFKPKDHDDWVNPITGISMKQLEEFWEQFWDDYYTRQLASALGIDMDES